MVRTIAFVLTSHGLAVAGFTAPLNAPPWGVHVLQESRRDSAWHKACLHPPLTQVSSADSPGRTC